MNIEQAVLEKLRQLPIDKQQELLNFAEFLYQKNIPKATLRSVRGLCADLAMDITEQDITETRQEMWGNFPRDIVF
ncbi:DUF2281 domain-containing protein [Nostoc sp. LEGE 12450]|uniref:DUF2281 domain-containing protein n=1 Tax=Nostoc sp. LEGE 12450 TaxID=1828643 RepID=UPI001882F5EB|nr:DUF2281 domain-containing protein [Nostoc sp. LEGE 12450]MBE8990303.1 DUF2281 domain-containing protein [Nostoc sp. LEGE 12450]